MTHPTTRRAFLQGAAATAALAAAPFDLFAQAKPNAAAQKFRIGHNLTTYVSGGRGVDGFWRGIGDLASQKVFGTEVDDGPSQLTATYGNDPAAVKTRLAKYDMRLLTLYHTLPLSDASKFQESIDSAMRVGKFLKAVGGDILNLAGGPRPQPDPKPEFQAMAKLVNEMGKRLLEEYGIRLGIHPHRGHMVENGAEVDMAMEMTNPKYFSLCPDTGHLLAAGTDPLGVFQKHRSRIIYMHYKDYDPKLVTARTKETGRTGGFVELGKGVVAFPPITELLLKTAYDGWVMIELDRAPAAEIDAVKTNLAYMTQTLGLRLG